jgi:carboxymethylenebutenolidase
MRCFLLVALVACGASSSRPVTPQPQPAGAGTDNRPAQTGPLTEAEFKALHEPPSVGPADRKGQRIELSGGSAYLSLPEGKGPFPGIVVIHEWWGLNANIEHWADRLATAGWAAVAVDLYRGAVATTRDEAMAAVKAVEPDHARATIKAAIDFLATDPRIAAKTRAVIGWCFGGGWSLQSAIAFPELNGAIIYYGQLETDPDKLAAIRGRVLGIFGDKDKGIPPEVVNQFDAALGRTRVWHRILRYDADHAFANPSNPKYDETAAAAAWRRVLAFLAELRQ